MKLSNKTRFVLGMLESHGHHAYVVGGAVRDGLLSAPVFDTDIATDALPQKTKEIFSNYPVLDTGIRHGTVTVTVEEEAFEITTFRSEAEYSDCRHPDRVVFCTGILEDLARRDFTINAMAFSEKDGLVDPYGGQEDLKNGIIRAVGDSKKRFCEDALRILRGLRFSAQLGFEIEENTYIAMLMNVDKVAMVSRERVYHELKKMVMGDHISKVLSRYGGIIERIIPVSESAFFADRLPKDASMRFACLFGEKAGETLEALKSDAKTRRRAELLGSSSMLPDTAREIKSFVSRYGREDAKLIALYRRCLYSEDPTGLITAIADSDQCLTVSELAVDGEDLLALGFKGASVGKVLKKLLSFVLNGDCPNEKEVLINRAKVIDKTRFV